MVLYILAACFGFVLHALVTRPKQTLDNDIFKYLKAGRQVVLCVDDDATIMKMVGDKMYLRKAKMDFQLEDEDGAALDNVLSGEFRNDLPKPKEPQGT